MSSLNEIIRLTERATFSDADHTTVHKHLASAVESLNAALISGVTPVDGALLAAIQDQIDAINAELVGGFVGPPGPPGDTLAPVGVVPDPGSLPTSPAVMTVLVDQLTSHLWVYDPSSPVAGLNGWVDMGQVGGLEPSAVPDLDTGWRDVTALIEPWWRESGGADSGVWVRRSGNLIAVRVDEIAISTSSPSELVFVLPRGFTHLGTWRESVPMVVDGGIGGAAMEVRGAELSIRSVNLSAEDILYSGQLMWLTSDVFPAVLPGTAAT